MSTYIELPQEIRELFKYSDRDGLLKTDDLENAGFEYIEDPDLYRELGVERWRKNNVELEYSPESREIIKYDEYKIRI